MSTTSDAVLAKRLEVYFQAIYANMIWSPAFFAIQAVMCTQCLFAYLGMSKERRRGRMVWIYVTFLLFLLDTVYRALLNSSYYPLMTQYRTVKEGFALQSVMTKSKVIEVSGWFSVLAMLLADGVMVYRCFVVWTGRRWVVLIPILSWIGELIVQIWSTTLAGYTVGAVGHNVPKIATLTLITATQMSVAVLIGYRLLRLRHRQRAIIENFDDRVHMRALIIVAESAVPYALASLFAAICVDKRGAYPAHYMQWNIAERVATAFNNIAHTLCPQIIIWRGILGDSFANGAKKREQSAKWTMSLAFRRTAGKSQTDTGNDFDSSKIDSVPAVGYTGSDSDSKIDDPEKSI